LPTFGNQLGILFDSLWLAGLATLLGMSVWGYVATPEGQRAIASCGLISSALLVASQGLVMLIGVLWMFPLGLYHGYFLLRGININSVGFPPAWFFLTAWGLYLGLALGYVFSANLTLRRIVWTILIAVLLANIGGCQTMISSLKRIP
jgi:hypothetical protein